MPIVRFALALALLFGACGTDAVPPIDATSDQSLTPHLSTVETIVEPSTIATGGATTVTCVGKDQFGDEYATDLPLAIEVSDANDQMPAGVTVEGQTVTAQYAGVVRVRCYYPGTPYVGDTSPISLVVQPGAPASIKTTVLKTELVAGDRIGVACSVRDALENSTAGETVLDVVPDTGVTTTSGKTVRFTSVGTFSITCALADGTLSGNSVEVHVAPGELAALDTVLSRDTIATGEEVGVTCPGRDAYGNTVPLERVITLPVDGLTPLDENRLRLTSTRAGVYAVTCVPKEAFLTVARAPASLTVLPGDPAAITMDLDPDRTVYALDARPRVTARLTDAWGNEIADASGVSVEARFGNTLRQTVANGQRVTLDAEGTWTITARLGALSVSRTVLVDASAPTIDITFPQRGEMVTHDGGPLTVTGVVSDATGGLASVKVNGVPRPLQAGTNRFDLAVPISPRHGLNTLTVEAVDVQGQTVKIAQSYLVAPGWKSAAQSFSDGIIAHMTRAFIDDGTRTGRADDLATILERVVGAMDIGSYIPSPAVQYAGYEVFLRNVRYAPPAITLTPSRDRLLLHMDITSLSIDVDAQGFIDVSGVVSASAIRVDVQLGITVQQGQPRVTAQTVVVLVEGLDIDVHWSINWLIDLFTDTIRDNIVKSFEDVLRDEVPPAVQDALASLAIDETFEVPPFLPGMSPLNVRLQARPDRAIIDERGLDLALGTLVSAARKVPWATSGSLVRGGCFGIDLGLPAWQESRKLTMALSLDVLNQVLHAVWQGGALEMTLGAAAFGDVDLSQYGVSDLSLDLSARLPPVLSDCNDGALKIQLGELHLDADMKLSGQPLVVDMIVAFETTADVSVSDDGEISLALGEIAAEDIVIDITRVESDLFSADQEDVLVTLLREQLLGKVLGDFAGQGLAGFPLPEFDLGGISPSLAGQKIAITDIVLGRDKGFLLLQGNP